MHTFEILNISASVSQTERQTSNLDIYIYILMHHINTKNGNDIYLYYRKFDDIEF